MCFSYYKLIYSPIYTHTAQPHTLVGVLIVVVVVVVVSVLLANREMSYEVIINYQGVTHNRSTHRKYIS